MNETAKLLRTRKKKSLRDVAILAHRYVGLSLVVFLTVAGLTGSLLAFYNELDGWMNPELFYSAPQRENRRSEDVSPLDPFEVTRRVNEQMPEGQVFRWVRFDPEPGRTFSGWSRSGEGEWRQWFVDPYDGQIVGSRHWGDLHEGRRNIMPFIYKLHVSLGLEQTGTFLFGIVALLWTLDTFVAAYITMPPPKKKSQVMSKSWMIRWAKAWRIRVSSLFSFMFTWHRAAGLWLFSFLFIFAWSGVRLNWPAVYQPMMHAAFGTTLGLHETLPSLAPSEPKVTIEEAHLLAREALGREALARGFSVLREHELRYLEEHGVYVYTVFSTLDIQTRSPHTEVYVDGQSGGFIGFDAATGIRAGNTLSSWLVGLHMAAVFGVWYKFFVVFFGLVVAGLSLSGVVIWWRKRNRSKLSQKWLVRVQPRFGK